MTIARELVTRLSFAFDRSNLDKFEKAISSFKTKFDVARLAIQSSFGRLIDFAQNFSNKILSNNALAKFSKTSIQELDALQNVFKKFNVPEESFKTFFGDISQGILEATRGVDNEFRRLVIQSREAVRLYVNGQVTTTKQAIEDIFKYIKSIESESEKIRIVSNIFKVDYQVADEIVKLASLTKEQFDSISEKEKQSLKNLQDQIVAAQNFKKQINELNTEWDKFLKTSAEIVVPILTTSIGGGNILIEKFKNEGLIATHQLISDSIGDFLSSLFGGGVLNNAKFGAEQEQLDFNRRLTEEYSKIGMQAPVNITNNTRFEFNVPPGTSEEQATFMTDQIEKTFENLWQENTREVINNNPQYEGITAQ